MFGAFQTFGKLGAIGKAISAAWSPSALWPTGTEPGMWISPRTLDSQWQDSTGTTPVSTPGTVADSSNPVGLALDLRLGAPTTLGPELVVNGDFSNGSTDWTVYYGGSLISFASNRLEVVTGGDFLVVQSTPLDTTKMYLLEWDQNVSGSGRFIMYLGQNGEGILSGYGVGHRQFIVHPSSPANGLYLTQSGLAAGDWIDNISVREVPGNHMLQATSTARPLGSARVNLLFDSYIQNSSNWEDDSPGNITITPNSAIAPNGQQVAATLEVVEQSWALASQLLDAPSISGVTYTLSYWARVTTGTLPVTGSFGLSTTLTTTWQEVVHSGTSVGEPLIILFSLGGSPTLGTKVEFWNAQLTRSDAQIASQPVSAAKTYPSAGFPIYQKYDGTDDGMATASFAAGTLSNAMDCMIAVRRDSGALVMAGLYETYNGSKFSGIAEAGSDILASVNCGSPTVWVDGVQLTGGTTVTRGTLHTALTVGDYHVLEFRGLDLSTWTALGYGNGYVGHALNGAQGGILLFPSSTSTADRDAARTWLGAKVGLTL